MLFKNRLSNLRVPAIYFSLFAGLIGFNAFAEVPTPTDGGFKQDIYRLPTNKGTPKTVFETIQKHLSTLPQRERDLAIKEFSHGIGSGIQGSKKFSKLNFFDPKNTGQIQSDCATNIDGERLFDQLDANWTSGPNVIQYYREELAHETSSSESVRASHLPDGAIQDHIKFVRMLSRMHNYCKYSPEFRLCFVFEFLSSPVAFSDQTTAVNSAFESCKKVIVGDSQKFSQLASDNEKNAKSRYGFNFERHVKKYTAEYFQKCVIEIDPSANCE